ncbi:hypothetical protein EYF80_001247 [Liparis tanakae]|uniref:Uncharacterized protein n=1 Tax=Liparis tanakae TaxID=230148 RepID=A0A4Z2JDV8_9TELE|nr:hypothetical protein EYF80_001247 [Liparis tanakae]
MSLTDPEKPPSEIRTNRLMGFARSPEGGDYIAAERQLGYVERLSRQTVSQALETVLSPVEKAWLQVWFQYGRHLLPQRQSKQYS